MPVVMKVLALHGAWSAGTSSASGSAALIRAWPEARRVIRGSLRVVPEGAAVFGGAGVPVGSVVGGCWAGCVQNGGD